MRCNWMAGIMKFVQPLPTASAFPSEETPVAPLQNVTTVDAHANLAIKS